MQTVSIHQYLMVENLLVWLAWAWNGGTTSPLKDTFLIMLWSRYLFWDHFLAFKRPLWFSLKSVCQLFKRKLKMKAVEPWRKMENRAHIHVYVEGGGSDSRNRRWMDQAPRWTEQVERRDILCCILIPLTFSPSGNQISHQHRKNNTI